MAKIGANEPCPCGSGKKYKQCCRKKDLAQEPEKIRTRLSWESMVRAKPEERLEIASALLKKGGFSPHEVNGWISLAQLSQSRDNGIATMAFEQGCRIAKTPADWRDLSHVALEMGLLDRAWEILDTHIPPEHDDIAKDWATRAYLLSLKQRWEEAAHLWEKQIEATQKADFLWRWMTCLRNAKQLDALQAACVRAEQIHQDPIWRIVWANAISLLDREDEAVSVLHEAFIPALKAPPNPQHDPTERIQRELILLEAAILHLSRLEITERTVFFRVLLKRKVPALPALFEARSDIAVLCSAWAELLQETTRWSAHESSPKARWLRRVAQQILTPSANEIDANTEIPAFWTTWSASLQNNLLHALLEHDALDLVDALFASLPPPQEEQQLFLWATLRAKQGAWQTLAQTLASPPLPLNPQLAMLYALAVLRTQGAEAAAPLFDAIETSEDNELALSVDLWRVEIACTLHKEAEGMAILDHIATYTPPAQRNERYWIWRAHLANHNKQLDEVVLSMQALFALRPIEVYFSTAARALFLLEKHHEAIAWLQQHRTSVRWSQDLSWILACCAVRTQQWNLAFDALQTLDEAWIAAQDPKKHVWPLRAHTASKRNRWLDTLAACERWQLDLDNTPTQNTTVTTEAPDDTSSQNTQLTDITDPTPSQNADELNAPSAPSSTESTNEVSAVSHALPADSPNDAEDILSLHALRRLAIQHLLFEAEHPWLLPALPALTGDQHDHPLFLTDLLKKETAQDLHAQQETLFEQLSSNAPHPSPRTPTTRQEDDTLSLLLSHASSPAHPLPEAPYSTIPTQALHPPEEQVYVEAWGEDLWAFLPKGTQQTFASAERLWNLLSQEEDTDHAPILLQWTRGLEALINLHLVDPLVCFAERRLGLHIQRDLPRLAGRNLQSHHNQIGLGSLPFLLAEQWTKPDPSDEKDEIAYNYLITSGQRLLWTAWFRHLKETLPPRQSHFLQHELPSLCAKLAHLRAQAAHATTALSRQRIQQIRQDLFLQKDALLIPSLARPLASSVLR